MNQKISKNATAERIYSSFITLAMQKPWEDITVKEICAGANITRGTFYRYFDDTNDLMDQIRGTLIKYLQNAYRAAEENSRHDACVGPRARLDCDPPLPFEVWFLFCKEHKDAMITLMDEDTGDPGFQDAVRQTVVTCLRRMMYQDNVPQDPMGARFLDALYSMHISTMRIWLTAENSISERDMARILNALRVGGLYRWYQKNNISAAAKSAPAV